MECISLYMYLERDVSSSLGKGLDSESIGDLLFALKTGELVLPDFQRGYVWDVERCKGLLASLILGYPLGAILIGTDTKYDHYYLNSVFGIPAIEYIKQVANRLGEKNYTLGKTTYTSSDISMELYDLVLNSSNIENKKCRLLLDGQQRLTSLNLLFSDYFTTCGGNELRSMRYRWFIDLKQLGLMELEFPSEDDLRSRSHEDVKEFIVNEPYLLTKQKKGDYDGTRKDIRVRDSISDLTGEEYSDEEKKITDFVSDCKIIEDKLVSRVLFPLDKLFIRTDKTIKLNDDFIESYMEELFKNTAAYNHLYPQDESNVQEKKIRKRFKKWISNFCDFAKQWLNSEILKYEVNGSDIARAVGIFSVINMNVVKLDTFDLLVAKSTTKEFKLRIELDKYIRQITEEDIDRPQLHPTEEVNQGFNFIKFYDCEVKSKSGETTVELSSRLRNWFMKTLYLIHLLEFSGKNNTHMEKCGDTQILSMDAKRVAESSRDSIVRLYRAGYFMFTSLGMPNVTSAPYEIMILALANVMDDDVWAEISKGPASSTVKRLKVWFWFSLFGGTYDKTAKINVVLKDLQILKTFVTTKMSPKDFERAFSQMIEGTDKRFTDYLSIAGYCDKDVLTKGNQSTLDKLMKSFLLSTLDLQDFPYKPNDPSKNDPKWKVNEEKYVCRELTVLDTIHLDHIFALDSHNKEVRFQSEKIQRTSEHKINSPLAKAPISAESNSSWGPVGPEKKLKAILKHCSDKGGSQLLDLDNGWSGLGSQSITESAMNESLLDKLLDIRFNLLKKRLDGMIKSENL